MTALPEPPGRAAIAVRVAGVAAIAGGGIMFAASGLGPSPSEVRDWGDGLGGPGIVLWPFIFCAFNMLLPWPLVAGATGAVFGAGLGTLLSLIGIGLCSTLQWWIARRGLGHHVRERALERVPRLDVMLERNDYLTVFYTRLAPVLPWGVVNYAAGLARVRVSALWFGTFTAGAPKVFAYATLGGTLDNLGSAEARVAIAVWAALAVVGLVVGRRALRGGAFGGGQPASA